MGQPAHHCSSPAGQSQPGPPGAALSSSSCQEEKQLRAARTATRGYLMPPFPVAFLLAPVGRGGTRRARPSSPRHHPARLHRLATATPRVISSAPPRPPWTPSLSPSPLFLSSASSLSLARAQPQPRHRNAAATVSPSTPRCACELHLDVPDLLDKPRRHGRAATPPSPPSSSPWPEIAAARFAATRTPPSSPTPSFDPL